MSRHLAEAAGSDVFVNFAQNGIELSIGDIAFHLLVPIIVPPSMKPGCQFSALLKRQLFNSRFDLFHAHVLTLRRAALSAIARSGHSPLAALISLM